MSSIEEKRAELAGEEPITLERYWRLHPSDRAVVDRWMREEAITPLLPKYLRLLDDRHVEVGATVCTRVDEYVLPIVCEVRRPFPLDDYR